MANVLLFRSRFHRECDAASEHCSVKPPTSGASYVRDEQTGSVPIQPREKLLQRLPAATDLVEALDDVHGTLAIATELYEHHGDGGCEGVYRAMVGIINHFMGQGFPSAVLEPIRAVMAAIIDADDGTESAIFKPDRAATGGKPRKAIELMARDGHIAAVMECCCLHLKSEGTRAFLDPASRMAAQLVSRSRWPVSLTATEVREIRDRVKSSARLSPDRVTFDGSMTSATAQSSPLAWAKLLLAHDWVIMPPKKVSA